MPIRWRTSLQPMPCARSAILDSYGEDRAALSTSTQAIVIITIARRPAARLTGRAPIVRQSGEVCERDLGPETPQRAAEITLFDPDKEWQKAETTPP
jgi:hypothetical protein